MLCERCGTMTNGNTSVQTGGAHCHLCAACRNAWHTYDLELPETEDLLALQARKLRMQALIEAHSPPDEREFLACLEEQAQIERQLFHLACAWLATQPTDAQEPQP